VFIPKANSTAKNPKFRPLGISVVLAVIMMIRSSGHHMRQRAQLQDDGQLVILALAVIAAIASLVAIAGELAVVKDMHGFLKGAHIALAGFTVLSSWAFTQVMFSLHYANEYYAAASRGGRPGLQFPNDEEPNYGDFFYFAAIIGTSGQTADVSFVTKPMRRIGSLHCILAYLFNTTVLALLINIGASMFLRRALPVPSTACRCLRIERRELLSNLG
jgi:uncharacterized membrane protein